jgi:prepilin-type N-terminal cleavage/methylation domain-containing protein
MKTSVAKARGFTLIELLVVIAIIGILSSVVLVSLNSARVKARESRRASDMVQVINALELYFDAHGRYPAASAGDGCAGSRPNYCLGDTDVVTALAPFLKAMPHDPRYTNGSTDYIYQPTANGSTYVMMHWDEGINNWCWPTRQPSKTPGHGWLTTYPACK